MVKIAKSFGAAFKGLHYCIKNESHMRFHIVAGFYVLWFSFVAYFSKEKIALLSLLIGTVIMAECINTAIEVLSNKVTSRYDRLIKCAKDVSAGAVLAISIFSVIISIIFFLDKKVIRTLFSAFTTSPLMMCLLLISIVLSIIFGVFYPKIIGNK